MRAGYSRDGGKLERGRERGRTQWGTLSARRASAVARSLRTLSSRGQGLARVTKQWQRNSDAQRARTVAREGTRTSALRFLRSFIVSSSLRAPTLGNFEWSMRCHRSRSIALFNARRAQPPMTIAIGAAHWRRPTAHHPTAAEYRALRSRTLYAPNLRKYLAKTAPTSSRTRARRRR